MAGSALVHASAVLAVITFAGATASVVEPRSRTELTFVHMPAAPPDPPVRLPALPKEQVRRVEVTPPPKPPAPIPERLVARAEPIAPEPEPVAENPIEPPRPRAAPTVSVGSFDTAANTRVAEVARAVQPAGFDASAARTANTPGAKAVVGAFDSGSSRTVPGSARGAIVSDAGFGTGAAAGQGRGRSGAVVSGGFDAGNGSGGGGAKPSGSVKTADFDAPQATAAPQVARQAPTEIPLEILSKPTPAYTDDARARKIEGEVMLEVEFAAAGEIRVLRVVRGLGHGLDESAIRAVQSIRFKPALRNGQPVDIRTTLNIVFRLA